MTNSTARPPAPASFASKVLSSPVPWGLALTALFYVAIPKLPNFADWGQTLFCGHPLAYATTALFWIGIAELGRSWRGLPVQRLGLARAARVEKVPGQPVATAERLLDQLDTKSPALRDTLAFERLRSMARYVRGRRSSDGLTSHLEYLAEFAGERLHNSFALVRTITWAVPILGFLGTVIGITQAISNLDPAKLESSFGMVAGGLGVAFGTTALSLGLSLFLVFGTYLVEKQERLILAEVELLAVSTAIDLFPSESAGSSAMTEASQDAARQMLEQSELLIRQQVSLWQESLEELRTRWQSTMERQVAGLDDGLAATQTALNATLSETLGSHRELLTGHRELITERRDAQSELVQTLDQLVASQTESAAAQQELAKQLASDRQNSSLDETLHTLTAAIHLLSARAGTRAA